MPVVNDILAVIMGGGRGTRLYPLTKLRAKPAVPIAGKYRLIDTTLSNCINSGIYRILRNLILFLFIGILHAPLTSTPSTPDGYKSLPRSKRPKARTGIRARLMQSVNNWQRFRSPERNMFWFWLATISIGWIMEKWRRTTLKMMLM